MTDYYWLLGLVLLLSLVGWLFVGITLARRRQTRARRRHQVHARRLEIARLKKRMNRE
jgi:hypothetical protein